jgi:hypothetical protein
MIGLPAALAPWASLLKSFPEDVAGALGPFLQRLALAIGPFCDARRLGDGEPEGVSGLARRGSYDRLLLSEWLLADEVPEEFVRRAAMQEHLFLELSRTGSMGSRRSVALLDAGPSQLGAPRVGHLATLILLAQRAEDAGADFTFAVLQSPGTPLTTKVSPGSLLWMLNCRRAEEVEAEHLAQWERQLALSKEDELWMVGAARLDRFRLPGSSRLAFEETLVPGERRLVVAVRRSTQEQAKELVLDLPDPKMCARLLRDPFQVEVAAPRRDRIQLAKGSGLLFAPNGKRLFARLSGGGLIAFSVPSSPREPPGKPRRFPCPEGETVLAAGWHHRRMLVLTASSRALTVYGLGTSARNGFLSTEVPLPIAGVSGQRGGRLSALLTSPVHGVEELFLADGSGSLLRVQLGPEPRSEHLERGVKALGLGFGGVVYLVREPGAAVGVVRVIRPRGTEAPWENLSGTGTFEAFIGQSGAPGSESGLLAVRLEENAWRVLYAESLSSGQVTRFATPLHPPADGAVVGVVHSPYQREPALLFLVEPHRRKLVLLARSWSQDLPPASAPIAAVAVSPVHPVLAYLTTAGEVVLHSLERGDTALARFAPAGDP